LPQQTPKMTNKEKLDFYRSIFDKEDLRRQEIYSALNIPIAFFSALVSAIYFLISRFNYNTESFLKITFLIFIGLSSAVLLVTLYYLLKANTNIFGGYIYSNIPSSSELVEYNKQLQDYYETNFNNPTLGDEEFENQLIKIHSDNADYNNYINEKRHSYIYVSKQLLIIAVILIIICLIPFGYNKMNLADNTNNLTSKTEIKTQEESIAKSKLQSTENPVSNQNIIIIETPSHQVKTISARNKKKIYLNEPNILKDTCIKILKHK
jgi:hypothetical protein